MVEVGSALESSRHGAGNVRWMAPELLDGSIPNSPEADVYSFACLAFHVGIYRVFKFASSTKASFGYFRCLLI